MADQKQNIEAIVHPVELDELLVMQERGWRIQKIGWFIILAIMLAGLMGVFGSGWISKRSPAIGNIRATYEGFFRYETEMKILIESGVHINSISLPQRYVREFRTLRFEPLPFNNHTEEGDIVFNFLPADNRIVNIYLIPKKYGAIDGTLKINLEHTLPLHHYIYP
ncbi:MAG TPA: hypothetical protein VD794_04450 [Flavisolibacter sp.]|nr:hypothetical protein [Flavisolibacter sp.]